MFFAVFAIELGKNAVCFNYSCFELSVLNTKIIINNVTAAKEHEKKWILSTINKKMQPLPAFFVKPLLYTPIDKCKVAQIDTQLCFKFELCGFLAKITLKSNFNMFFA